MNPLADDRPRLAANQCAIHLTVPLRVLKHGLTEADDSLIRLDEFYRVAFRMKAYPTIEALQTDADGWMREYNEERTHSGKYCYGKTPMQTFRDSIPLAKEKFLDLAVQVGA